MSFHFRLLCSPVPPLESDAIRKRLVGTLRSGPWSFQKCSKKGMGRGINCKFYKDSNYRATFILWYNFSSAVCEDEKKYNNLEKKTLKLWLPITKLKIKNLCLWIIWNEKKLYFVRIFVFLVTILKASHSLASSQSVCYWRWCLLFQFESSISVRRNFLTELHSIKRCFPWFSLFYFRRDKIKWTFVFFFRTI